MLPFDPRSADRARRLVHAAVAPRPGLARLAGDAALMASELVANAIVHGGPPVTLRLAVGEAGLRCEVTDRGGRGSARTRAAGDAEHGRGLLIVAALASGHGLQRTPGGTTAWFELGPPAERGRSGTTMPEPEPDVAAAGHGPARLRGPAATPMRHYVHRRVAAEARRTATRFRPLPPGGPGGVPEISGAGPCL